MAYTWTEFLDDVKVRGGVPTSNNTFTAARFLALANGEFRTKMLPMMIDVREGYYSYDVDTTVNSTGVYNIPSRAIGGKLLNVALIDGTSRLDLTRYYEDDIEDTATAPSNYGFYVKNSQVIILPNVPNWSTLRLTIMLRPSSLIAVTDAAQITAINTGTKTLTCTTVPSTWTTASILDLVQAEPHFDSLAIDQVITAIATGSSGTITFSSTLPTRLAVGDWVSLYGTTPIIQLPLELHSFFAQHVANTCIRAQGDMEAYKAGIEAIKEMEDDILAIITPRVEDEGNKLVNRTGILRRGL